MRSSICILAAAGLLLTLTGPAQAAFMLIDNFDSYTSSDAINTKTDWGTSDGGAVVAVDPADAGNLVLHTSNRGADAENNSALINVTDGNIGTMFFRVNPQGGSEPRRIGFGQGTKFDRPPASLQIDDDDLELMTSGSGGNPSGGQNALDLDAWYKVWVVADHITNQFSVYLQSDTDVQFASQTLLGTVDFRLDGVPIGWQPEEALTSFISIQNNNPSANNVYIDDIYFSTGDQHEVDPTAVIEPAVPEPMTAGLALLAGTALVARRRRA